MRSKQCDETDRNQSRVGQLAFIGQQHWFLMEPSTMIMASPGRRGHRPTTAAETSKLLSFSIVLVTLACCSATIHCQEIPAASNTTDVMSNNSNNKTTTTSTDDNNPTTGSLNGTSVLLSSSEFVDFTEAPTLLFDGTSNEKVDTTTTESSQSSTNTTTTPEPKPTTTAPKATSISSTPEEATTTINAATESDEETTTTSVAESGAGDDDVEENNDQEQPTAKQPFEPPQNVSQYMDYIETLFHDFRHQISDLFEPHLPQLIRSSQMVQLSGSCSYDMLRMALALRSFEPWALRMIDSSGKVPEGIFEGSFTALGSYDECLNTVFGQEQSKQNEPPPANQTQGKYCLVNVSPYLPPKPPADRVERMFQEEANRRNYTKDNQFSRLSPMFYYMKFRIGVCIPSSCTETDMDSLSEALSTSLRLNITIPNCRIRQSQPITNHQLVGGLVFASVLALVLVATLMDYSKSKFDRQKRRLVASLSSAMQQPNKEEAFASTTNYNSSSSSSLSSSSSQGRFIERLAKNWSWLSFSLFTNYRLYFSSTSSSSCSGNNNSNAHQSQTASRKQEKQRDRQIIIKCLNGIRVISLCWVIVANSYITLDPRATKRLTKTREAPKDFFFQMVAQASLAIETFFFLSGVLMSLSFARKLQQQQQQQQQQSINNTEEPTDLETAAQPTDLKLAKAGNSSTTNGNRDQVQVHEEEERAHGDVQEMSASRRRLTKLRWIQFYVHRYVRMTPATMLVIAFTMYAYGYGDGPLWFEATHKAHQSCSQNWWRHLLHVANFIDTRQMCFIHYWYIAADMQLFLFAPLLLYLIYRYRKIGYALVTLIGATSVGFIFYTTYARNLPPTLLFYNSDPESRREFGNTIMTKPLTHALPYLVGMLVGKWLTSGSSGLNSSQSAERSRSIGGTGDNGQPATTYNGGGDGRRSLTSLFGAIATVVALAEVFMPYKWNNSHLPTRLLASLYAAFFRFAWSLVLAFTIMSCRHRRGRRCERLPVNDHHPETNGSSLSSSSASMQTSSSQCTSCQSLSSSPTVTLIVQQKPVRGKYEQDNIIMSSPSSSSSVVAAAAAAAAAASAAGRVVYKDRDNRARDDEWCLCGSGGNLVNRLLSLDVFTYLSKLSFVAYLIHLPLMSVFIAQTRGLFAFSHTLVIHLALSYLVMTFLLSFLLVHLIELPFLTFERYLFHNWLTAASASSSSSAQPKHKRRQESYTTGCYIVEPKTFIGGSHSSCYSINTERL